MMMASATCNRMIKKVLSRFLLDDLTREQIQENIITIEWLLNELAANYKDAR